MPEIDPEVRAAVRALPVAEAHAALAKEDPVGAARLQPERHGPRRPRAGGGALDRQPLDAWQRRRVGGIGGQVALRPLILLPPRDWLHERCDARFDAMVGAEARSGGRRPARAQAARVAAGDARDRRGGDRRLLRGQTTRDEAVAAGQAATRQYAKRQYTWFRHQPPPDWPRFEEPLEGGAIDAALRLLDAPG